MDRYAIERGTMVREQLRMRDIDDERVLAVMGRVPRHEFVPPEDRGAAYEDGPLPIGHGATISQPYIVALMTQLAQVAPGQRVLDVGTGSGYQAAVLAELGAEVYGVEIVDALAQAASERLSRLGYDAVTVRQGDGHLGWPEHAPFDAIIVAAATPSVPAALLEQLAIGGRMVIPVGPAGDQSLELIVRDVDGLRRRHVTPVRFVPLV